MRPIGVGEVLQRTISNAVMYLPKKHIVYSSSDIQMCAGQTSCREAAIHTIRYFHEQKETKAIILLDAANALNNISRKFLVQNIKTLCPFVSTYVLNCYSIPARSIYSRKKNNYYCKKEHIR